MVWQELPKIGLRNRGSSQTRRRGPSGGGPPIPPPSQTRKRTRPNGGSVEQEATTRSSNVVMLSFLILRFCLSHHVAVPRHTGSTQRCCLAPPSCTVSCR